MSLIGALLVTIGVFCPFVSVPIMGSMSYFGNGKGDGSIVLVAALIAGGLALTRAYKPAAVVGLAILGVVGVTVVRFQSKMSDMRSEMANSLRDNPFAGLAEGLANSVQLQWGVGMLVVGSILIIVAGFWNPTPDHAVRGSQT